MSIPPETRHIEIQPPVLYVGTPVALVTSCNADGTANITPMSSIWALADRVVLGLSATSQGRENILREGELVINFPSPQLHGHVEAMARATGRSAVPAHKRQIGYRFEADKFPLAGLTPQAALSVRPPRIAECPLQFEAEVVASHDPGGEWPSSRPESFQIIEARMLRVHAHEGIVIPGTHHVDTARWSPLLYVFRHYFGTGPDLGASFKSQA